MNLITYIDNIDQAKDAKNSNINEVIIGNILFSRFGKVSPNKFNSLVANVKDLGLRVVFDWDILMTEKVFNEKIKLIKEIDFENIDAIRLQDPGALLWIKKNFPNLNIQLNLENGNHNLIGIKKWIELSGKKLERVILSIELPKEKLAEYTKEISTPIEFFIAGRILIFYTPRSLVGPYIIDHEDNKTKPVNEQYIELTGSSEESPHKGFPIVENIHGTFMFNTKDQYLCDHVHELVEIGIEHFRFDVRHIKDHTILEKLTAHILNPNEESSTLLKESYDPAIIRGFYHVNKSDILFKKLKNQRTQRKDELYIGDVLDVKKKKHIALMVKSRKISIKIGDKIVLNTPDGKIKKVQVESLSNSSGTEIKEALFGQICYIKHVSGISVKTNIYLDN
jgi:putative protease